MKCENLTKNSCNVKHLITFACQKDKKTYKI